MAADVEESSTHATLMSISSLHPAASEKEPTSPAQDPQKKKPPPRKGASAAPSPSASSVDVAQEQKKDASVNEQQQQQQQPSAEAAPVSDKPSSGKKPPPRKSAKPTSDTVNESVSSSTQQPEITKGADDQQADTSTMRTVFLGNFPMKDTDFGEGFQDFHNDTMQYFSSFGKIETLSIPRAGAHRGEIYIHYSTPKDADKAVAEIHGSTIEARTVTATLVSETALKYADDAAKEAESVVSISDTEKGKAPSSKRPPPRKSATPAVHDPAAVEMDIEPVEPPSDTGAGLSSGKLSAPKPTLRKGPPPKKSSASPSPSTTLSSRTILLKNVPITDEDFGSGYDLFCAEMKDEFQKHGEIELMVVPRSGPSKGEIYVQYKTEVDASIAQSSLKGRTFAGQVLDAVSVPDSQAIDAEANEKAAPVALSSKPKGPPPRKSEGPPPRRSTPSASADALSKPSSSSSSIAEAATSLDVQSSPKRGPPPRKDSPSASSSSASSSSPSSSLPISEGASPKRPPPSKSSTASTASASSNEVAAEETEGLTVEPPVSTLSESPALTRTLFVKNLPFDDTDLGDGNREMVSKEMRQEFIKFGHVGFLALVSSGEFKGMLVLQYSNEEEALKAFSAIQGKVLAGKELESSLELDSSVAPFVEFAFINEQSADTKPLAASPSYREKGAPPPRKPSSSTLVPGSPKRPLSDTSSVKSFSDRPNKPKPAEVAALRDSLLSKAQKEAENAAISARAAAALATSVVADVIGDERQNFQHAITVASRAAAESTASQVARISEMRADDNTRRALEDAERVTNQIKADAERKEQLLIEDTERQLKLMKEDAQRSEKAIKEDAERKHAAMKEESEKREKLLQEEAEKKAIAIKEESERRERALMAEAEMKASALKEEAEKKELLLKEEAKALKLEAEKKEKFLREEGERKAKALKEEAERKEQALRDEADKYQRAVRAEAEKHFQLVKEAQLAEERRAKEDEKIMYSLAKNTHDYERVKKQAEEERSLREETLAKLRAAEKAIEEAVSAKEEALMNQMKFQISAIRAIAAAQTSAINSQTTDNAAIVSLDVTQAPSSVPPQEPVVFSSESLERNAFITSWEARIKARVGDIPILNPLLSSSNKEIPAPQSSFSSPLKIPVSIPSYAPVNITTTPIQKASVSYLSSGASPRNLNPVQVSVEGPERLVAEREALDRALSAQQAQLESLKHQQETLQKSINEKQQSTFVRSYFDAMHSKAAGQRSPSTSSPLLPSRSGYSPTHPGGRSSPLLSESAAAAAAVAALLGNKDDSELASFAPTNIFNAPPPTPVLSSTSARDDHDPPPIPSRRTQWSTLPSMITQELIIKRPDKEESKLLVEANGVGPQAIGFKVLKNRLSSELSTFSTASAISFGDNITQAMLQIDKLHIDLLKEDEARLAAEVKAAVDESKVIPDEVKASIQTTPMLSLALAFHTVDCALLNMRETKDDASPWQDEPSSSSKASEKSLVSSPFAGETIVALLGGVSNQVSASAAAVTSSLATASASEEIMWKTVKGLADMRAMLSHGEKLVAAAREQGELNLASKFHEWRDITAAESVLKDTLKSKVSDLAQLQAILREGLARVRSLRLHCSAERARMDTSILAHARDIAEFEGYNLVTDDADADADNADDELLSSRKSLSSSLSLRGVGGAGGSNNSENLQRRKGGPVDKLSLKRLLRVCEIESVDAGRSRRLGKSLASTVRETTVFFEIVFGEKISRYREEVARRLVAVKRDTTRSEALERHNQQHQDDLSPTRASPTRDENRRESEAEAKERRLREWESGGAVPKATERTFYYPEEKAIARVYSQEVDDVSQARLREIELKEARASEFAILKRLTTINEQLPLLASAIKKAAELSRVKKIVNNEWKQRDHNLDVQSQGDSFAKEEEHHGRANFLRAVIHAEAYSAPFYSALLDAEARLRAKGDQIRARFREIRERSPPHKQQQQQQHHQGLSSTRKGGRGPSPNRSRLVTPADYDSASSTSHIPVLIDGQLDSLPSNQSFAASSDAYTRTERQLQERYIRGNEIGNGAKTRNPLDADDFSQSALFKKAPIAYSSQRGYSAPLSFFQRAALEEEARKVRHSAVQRQADEYEIELSRRKVYKESKERAVRTETARRTANAAFIAPFWQDDNDDEEEDDDNDVDIDGDDDLPPLPREEKPPQKMTRR